SDLLVVGVGVFVRGHFAGKRDRPRVIAGLERLLDVLQGLGAGACRARIRLLARRLGIEGLRLHGLVGSLPPLLGADGLHFFALALGLRIRHHRGEQQRRCERAGDANGQAVTGGIHGRDLVVRFGPTAARAPVEPVTLSENPYSAHPPGSAFSHTTGDCHWPSPARRPAPALPRGYAIRRSGRSGPGAWTAIPGAGCRPPRSCSHTGSRPRADRSRREPSAAG